VGKHSQLLINFAPQKTNRRPRVVVGMSGGVDSSVSALLLKERGYEVIGLFMKNWEEIDENGLCPATLDYEDVVKVCSQIGIPHYSVNFAQKYWDLVFTQFLDEYQKGYTPNPDILCNREIKFKAFFQKALELGADYVATGHYCQHFSVNDRHYLGRGADPDKDQSYFLYTLKERVLEKVLFPIGHLHKKEVRALAEKNGLATAQKKDSTGICFIGKRNFRDFISQYIALKPGPFENSKGEVIGNHEGIALYTIGQRKGLKIGGEGEAWYVVDKDPKRNVVVIEQGEEHPALYRNSLQAIEVSWVTESPQLPYSCSAKIRYRHHDASCQLVEGEGPDSLKVDFDLPQKAITPRQSVVFYQGLICLGGAMIVPFNNYTKCKK
jgi:tRNA-uridine 2-sulfurtransferase